MTIKLPAVAIWVEGKSDEKFVGDFLNHLNFSLSEEAIVITPIGGGVAKLPKIESPLSILKNQDATNLLILDANGDFDSCCKAVEEAKAIPLAFDYYFLLPNHRDSGCLETLLESVAVDAHRGIFECFGDYEKCIKEKSAEYNTPDLKARIYAYCEALTSVGKEEKQDYCNSAHWNLDSPALDPLKEFLRKYLP